MIHELTLNNVEVGGERRLALGQLTALSGPVGSGKTSILRGIQIAALGYVPTLGGGERAPGGSAAVMSAATLDVEAVLDAGCSAARGWERNGALTSSALASWEPEDAPAGAQSAAIRELWGSTPEEARQHLDLSWIARSNPKQRQQAIQALMDATGMPEEERRALISQVAVLLREGVPLETIRQADPSRLPQMATAFGGALEEVEVTVDDARRRRLDAQRLLRDKQTARTELEDRRIGAVSEGAREVSVIEAELDQVRARLPDPENLAKERERRAKLVSGLEAARQALATAEEGAPQTEPQEPADPDHSRAEQLEAQAEELRESVAHLPGKADAERELETARNALQVAERDDWGQVLAAAKDLREGLADSGRLCRMSEAQLSGIISTAERNAPDLEAARQAVAEAEAALATATSADATRDRAAGLDAQAVALRSVADEAHDEEMQAYRAASKAWTRAERARSKVADLQERLADTPEAPEPEAGEELTARQEQLTAELEHARASSGIRREMDDLVLEVETIEREVATWQAVEKACQWLADREMSERSAGLVERMKDWLAHAGREECPIVDADRIGWLGADGLPVSLDTLSGGEFWLWACAFVSSVLAIRDPAEKTLLADPEGVLHDAGVLEQLLRGLERSAEWGIQVVVALGGACPAEREGWTVIDCAAQPAGVV